MNIVKFGSEKMVGAGMSELYNESFRNKYCYAIHMMYAVVFEDLTQSEYYEYERMDNETLVSQLNALPHKYIDIYHYGEFVAGVDIDATDKANDISRFIAYNNFTPDTEITLDELKKFRWWLAYTILEIYKDSDYLDSKDKDMLWYYRKNMIDNTVRHLENFPVASTNIQYNTTTRCSCTGGLTSATQLMEGLSTCDPVSVYRKGVYEYMVTKFSELSFWQDFENEFLVEFKKYIDGIIEHDLPLYTSEYVSSLMDCSCLGNSDSAQQLLMNILRNLSKALGYLITDDTAGHKNFIIDSFRSWASQLYEKMYWV